MSISRSPNDHSKNSLMLTKEKNHLKIIAKLAGSVTLPKRFRGMPIDTIIRKAKEVYFKRKLKENIRKGYQEYKNGRAKTIETLLQELK